MPPLPSTLTTWKLPTVRPIRSSSGSTDERSSPSSGQWRISSSYWVWHSGQVRDTTSPQVGAPTVDAPAEGAVKRSKDQPECGRAIDLLEGVEDVDHAVARLWSALFSLTLLGPRFLLRNVRHGRGGDGRRLEHGLNRLGLIGDHVHRVVDVTALAEFEVHLYVARHFQAERRHAAFLSSVLPGRDHVGIRRLGNDREENGRQLLFRRRFRRRSRRRPRGGGLAAQHDERADGERSHRDGGDA